jgi:integrase
VPRHGNRITIAKGIYRDGPDGPYEIRVTVGGHPYSARMPADSTENELKGKRAELEATGRTTTPRATYGTLRAGVPAYLRTKTHLASYNDLVDDLNVWCDRLGDVPRHRITEADILNARSAWLSEGLSARTINDRIGTLRNLLRTLDGKQAVAIFADIKPLPRPKTIIQRVADDLILRVDRALQEREQDPTKAFDGAKTRARFRVFVSTGKRPCEIMRAQPGDVNLKARVWVPRDAKGGYCPGVYLNDDQLEAWKLFIKANAWGKYNHGNFGRVIRHAGWPQDIKPYQARHTTWITASERGVDLSDISVGAGHKDLRTARDHYVPVLNSRLQRLGEALDGRFQGWRVGPKGGSAKRTRKSGSKSA